MKRLAHIACVFWLLFSVALPRARSQQFEQVETRVVEATWSKGAPRVSFPPKEASDRRVRKALNSGLPQTIVTRVYAYSEKGEALALSVRSCRVVYDLWEDLYRVQLQTERRASTRVLRTIDEVRRSCLSVEHMQLGASDDYRNQRGRRIYFAALIEVNPLSEKTVERIRRWLARPTGSDSLSRDSFFGSFVSIFVNRRIGSAERVFRFRSRLVRVP